MTKIMRGGFLDRVSARSPLERGARPKSLSGRGRARQLQRGEAPGAESTGRNPGGRRMVLRNRPLPTRSRSGGTAMSVRFSRGAALTVALAARGPSLTIYSGDLGLVRETRILDLAAERDTVRLTDIPFRLDFSSVRLVPDGDARVTRLAYRYDVE